MWYKVPKYLKSASEVNSLVMREYKLRANNIVYINNLHKTIKKMCKVSFKNIRHY